MLTEDKIDEVERQLRDYRQKDTLPGILTNYEKLIEDYRRLKSDYEEERDARERYKKQAKGQERNPFVLVLVDGDGYVLHDKFIQAGADGGSDAAAHLNKRVRSSLAEKGLQQCDIMVRVYANVVGLSKALSKAGLAGPEKRSLAPFIANFNRECPLTDFVDAGEYKENADFKLRGLLRLYAENAQCRHIFFAACHDGGYVSELSQYRGQTDRFTLIRTPGLHFHDEFHKLGLGVEELHGVFRPAGSAMDGPYPKPPQSLAAYNNNTYNGSAKAAPIATYPSTVAKPSANGEICRFYKTGKCRYGASCTNLHPDASNGGTLVLGASKLARDSWRAEPGVDQNSPPSKTQKAFLPPIDPTQLPKKAEIPEGHVAVNQNGHRLDAYIEPSRPDAERRFQHRTTTQHLCNALHITGSCANPGCSYDHGALEPELQSALEALARSVLCPKRGACRNPRCTHGHVCQKADCARRGGRNYCKLFDKGDDTLHITDLAAHKFVPGTAAKGLPVHNGGAYGGGSSDGGRLEQRTPTNSSAPSGSSDHGNRATASSTGEDSPPSADRSSVLGQYLDRAYVGVGAADKVEGEEHGGNRATTYCHQQGAAISGAPYPVRQISST